MEIKRCDKGHFYDAEIYSTCPQCEAESKTGGYDSLESTGMDMGGVQDYGATLPVGSFREQDAPQGYGPTQPAEKAVNGYGPTEGYMDKQDTPRFHNGVEDYGGVTMPVPLKKDKDKGTYVAYSPVTGWLACIEGASKGKSYCVHAGYNYIGRSEHMAICIGGDMSISRERHALIAYDHEENVFFFGPADGKSLVRVNGKMVMGPTEIHAYDVLTVGETKLMFVPLCGERFNWDE